MSSEKIFAWSVHAFTASGIIPAFFAIVAVGNQNFLLAFIMLMVAHFIDGVDGTLARKAKVTEVLPNMSGKMMDCIIDFSTYAIIPAYLLYLAPDFWPAVPYIKEISIMAVLLVSTLYYGKEGMVSSDYYFVGFPVLWNWVAFYLYYIFSWGAWANVVFIWICAILHFVPFKYIYPSRSKEWMPLNLTLFFLLMLGCIFSMLIQEQVWQGTQQLLLVSKGVAVILLLYFVVFGLYMTWKTKDLDIAAESST